MDGNNKALYINSLGVMNNVNVPLPNVAYVLARLRRDDLRHEWPFQHDWNWEYMYVPKSYAREYPFYYCGLYHNSYVSVSHLPSRVEDASPDALDQTDLLWVHRRNCWWEWGNRCQSHPDSGRFSTWVGRRLMKGPEDLKSVVFPFPPKEVKDQSPMLQWGSKSATNPVALVPDRSTGKVLFVTTVAPACKVSVLSKENWPYKRPRADLIFGHPYLD